MSETGGDPIEQEREEARQESEGSQLPSETGSGPGAGETSGGHVEAPAEPEQGDVPSAPSIGGPPPRHDQGRPDFRGGQLDEGGQSGHSDVPDQRESS